MTQQATETEKISFWDLMLDNLENRSQIQQMIGEPDDAQAYLTHVVSTRPADLPAALQDIAIACPRLFRIQTDVLNICRDRMLCLQDGVDSVWRLLTKTVITESSALTHPDLVLCAGVLLEKLVSDDARFKSEPPSPESIVDALTPRHKNQIVSDWLEVQVTHLNRRVQTMLSATKGKPDAAGQELMFLLAGLIELAVKSDGITITPGPLTAEIMSHALAN